MRCNYKNTNICMSQESHHQPYIQLQPHQKYSDIYLQQIYRACIQLACIKYALNAIQLGLQDWTPRIAYQADHILPVPCYRISTTSQLELYICNMLFVLIGFKFSLQFRLRLQHMLLQTFSAGHCKAVIEQNRIFEMDLCGVQQL